MKITIIDLKFAVKLMRFQKSESLVFQRIIKNRRFWGEVNNKHDRLSIL